LASRRSHLILVVLLLGALAGVALIGLPQSPFHKDLRKGLDLQGGLEVVLQAQPPKNHVLTTEDLDRSVEIMRSRVDKLGVSEPEIRKQGANQIVIELPAVHDQNQAAQIIGKTAQLELYDLTPSLLPPSIGASQNPVPITSLYNLLTRVQGGQKGTPTAYYLFDSKTKRPIAGPAETLDQLKKDRKTVAASAARGKTADGLPKGTTVLSVPPKATVVTCDSTVAVVCPGITPAAGVTYYYLFKHGAAEQYTNDQYAPYPQMKGDELKLSGTKQDFDPQSGQPIVTLQFTGKGNKIFHEITRDEAVRGRTLGVPQNFAIVLDNQLYSFPQIDYTKYPGGIDPTGGGAQITGMASLSEAKKLALVLQTGALPVRFDTVERSDVSATLGKDSLKQARNAALGGLLLVAIFLLVLYRFLGLVAVIGLGIYAALM
jgi:protein-export membrane protein SecD